MQRIPSDSIFVYLILILFVCPLVLGHVIYERKQRPNRNGDGEQVVEIFRTRCQPPSYGTSDRAVNRFLIDCELSTSRRRRPMRLPHDTNNKVPRITTTTTTLRTPTATTTTTTKQPESGWPWFSQRTTTTTTQRAIQPQLPDNFPIIYKTTTRRPPSVTTEVEPPVYEIINTSPEVMVPRTEHDFHPSDNNIDDEEDNDRDLTKTEDGGDNNINDEDDNDGDDEEEGNYETDNDEGTNGDEEGEHNYEEYRSRKD